MSNGMFTGLRRRGMAPLAALAVLGGVLGITAPEAAAWPIPLTGEDNTYLKATRGVFPGDDDQLLLVFSCRI